MPNKPLNSLALALLLAGPDASAPETKNYSSETAAPITESVSAATAVRVQALTNLPLPVVNRTTPEADLLPKSTAQTVPEAQINITNTPADTITLNYDSMHTLHREPNQSQTSSRLMFNINGESVTQKDANGAPTTTQLFTVTIDGKSVREYLQSTIPPPPKNEHETPKNPVLQDTSKPLTVTITPTVEGQKHFKNLTLSVGQMGASPIRVPAIPRNEALLSMDRPTVVKVPHPNFANAVLNIRGNPFLGVRE